MSADNWAVCPSCTVNLPNLLGPDPRTFREDYEFWLDDRDLAHPVVGYSYSGFCTVCGTGVKFNGMQDIKLMVRK